MIQAGPKDRLVLANLSNDGWFTHRGSYWDWLVAGFRNDEQAGPWQGTTEQPQHFSHYVYRAVEGRVPVVRAVNTGISGHIDSNGRVQSVIEQRAGGQRELTMIAGELTVRPLVDSRRSVYSLIGDVFAITVTVAAGFLIAWMIWRSRREETT
jgi:apolipoprotein N-acyltransferase